MSKTQRSALLSFFALTFGWTWGLWAIVTFQGLGLTGLGGVHHEQGRAEVPVVRGVPSLDNEATELVVAIVGGFLGQSAHQP